MKYYIEALKNYAVFTGRASRKQFWMFTLVSLIITIVLSSILSFTFGVFEYSPIVSGILDLYMLAILVPSIAITVRRLHDVKKSGWWLLLDLIPIIGALFILYCFIKAGDVGSNQYGEDPIDAELGHIPPAESPTEVPIDATTP